MLISIGGGESWDGVKLLEGKEVIAYPLILIPAVKDV